ncbi:MAG: bacterial Ig-like domain-containing protein [Spirochaetaceae bacterium]|nr:bacterial Ig-like domain-containing protein [Spirochaetaceae bacterium]
MKTRNSKGGNGGRAAGLLTIGLPLMAAAVIIMGGCTTLQSIAVIPPAKTVFAQGEEFTYEGLQVTGATEKGETRDLSGDSGIKVTGYDPDRTGEQTITVEYRGGGGLFSQPKAVTATYTVTVIGVESIAIDQAPATARQGMDIDRSDLRVTASYGDMITPRAVRGNEVSISGYNKDTLGAQTVTAEYYGKTAAFTVTVAALTGIRITKPPARASYFPGEPLDLAGLEVMGTWQGAGDAPVTPEYVSGFDTNVQGNQTVIVEALGKRASFTVTVKEPSDPATWTPAQGVFARNIIGVVYGNGRFVAVGYDDRPEDKIIAYSTDGIAWTKAPVQPGVFAKNTIGVVYGNGAFVVAGYNDDKNEGYVSDKLNESIIMYSTDGITWTRASTPERFRNIHIFFGNGKFVTIGNYRYQQTGTQQWTVSYYQAESSDGINWSDRNPLFALEEAWPSINYVFFDGSKFIALDRNGQYIFSTDNGKSWKLGEGYIRPITEAVSGNGKMVGIGGNGNFLGWSTDGIIWTDADQIESGSALNDAAYGFGMFVSVGSRGNIIYSRDGYTWRKVAASTFGSAAIHHVAYGGGRFVAIGDNGRIAYSNKID